MNECNIGILHSLEGPMALSEKPLIDAALFAIDEINNSGGILDSKIVPIICNGKSNPEVFKTGAEKLINQDKVFSIFGCWTFSSRKAVKLIV